MGLIVIPLGVRQEFMRDARKLGRRGRAAELNPGYFLDSAAYCRAEEEQHATLDFFDLIEMEAQPA